MALTLAPGAIPGCGSSSGTGRPSRRCCSNSAGRIKGRWSIRNSTGFRTIAESTSLPCMLYNIPGRTAVNLEASTIARLARALASIFAAGVDGSAVPVSRRGAA